MTGDMEHGDKHVSRTALKARVAGIVTASVAVSLVLVPAAEAFRISANHNETVLAFD